MEGLGGFEGICICGIFVSFSQLITITSFFSSLFFGISSTAKSDKTNDVTITIDSNAVCRKTRK